MPVSVIRLENQPILIGTLSGAVTVNDIVELFRVSAELMGDSDETIYRITDVRTATSNFIEMLGAIKAAQVGGPGSTTDPRIKATFVGTSTWVTFARNALKNPQFGGISLAAFPSMDDALTSIRIQIDAENRSDAM